MAQNHWTPDSTAYRYLSRGTNLEQWAASPGTRVEIDTTDFRTAGGSIKWIIPANTRGAKLDLRLIDLDLRDYVIYTTCKRNNAANTILAHLEVAPDKGFRLAEPVYVHDSGKHLPVNHWQQRGRTSRYSPFNGAQRNDLAHARNITFRAFEAEVEQVLWIDEIKYIRPRGPACIIHFNHYRDSADSLLTPWLIANGYRANLDFTYEFAEKEFAENRNNGGIWTRYVGLPRITELAKLYDWGTTHHGVFYKYLSSIPQQERMQVYALEPFQQAGFETQWCFSIPRDDITPEIYAELLALQRFAAIRRQGNRGPNELPLDEPQQLRFFRPTSASAGPNLGGTPRTLAQMLAKVDEVYRTKGLLIFDFGAIVNAPSPNYTDSEVTMLADAQALIKHADSLGFAFLLFKDLFAPDKDYQPTLSLNHDYALAARGGQTLIPVLANDLAPRGDTLRVQQVSPPVHGQIQITADARSLLYTAASNFAGDERFYYLAGNNKSSDTAWVFVTVQESVQVEDDVVSPLNFTLHQNHPNPFQTQTRLRFELERPSFVELAIYNLAGQRVAELIKENRSAGKHEVHFAGERLAAGIYFYRLKAGGEVATRKLVLMKPR